jgi:type I restriction enzyme S subunit
MSERKMKDSGVEWIGEIPEEWGRSSLKRVLLGSSSGGTPTSSQSDYYTEKENGTAWVTIGDMKSGKIFETDAYVTNEAIKDHRLKIVPAGSLLYAMYASVGVVAELKIPATTNQAILALYLNNSKIHKTYLKNYLLFIKEYLSIFTTGTTQQNLNADKVYNFPLLLPPLSEQAEIAEYLDRETSKIDSLLTEIDNQITLLKTYRKSLISEVVTGKREV